MQREQILQCTNLEELRIEDKRLWRQGICESVGGTGIAKGQPKPETLEKMNLVRKQIKILEDKQRLSL